MDVPAVLADVAELGPFFTVGTDPAPAEAGWRPMAELYADPEPLAARIAHVRRVLDVDDRVAASVAFQGLAGLIVAAPIAAVALHRVLPGLTGRALHWRPVEGSPWTLALPEPTGRMVPEPAAGAAGLAELLLPEHLSPLVAAVRAQVSVSERLLWGNVASAVAGAKRMLAQARPAAAGRAAAVTAGLLSRDRLAGTGRLLPPTDPDRNWTFRRRSCCLFYRVADHGLCSDCVLLDRPPR